MTPSARKELEKLRRWIRVRWYPGTAGVMGHYVQQACREEITRRLKAAKRKPDRIAKEQA